MQASSLDHALTEHAFVRDLDEKHVNDLIACSADERFRKGEYLWRQGDLADVFYLIGEVSLGIAVPNKGPIHIETVAKGDAMERLWALPYPTRDRSISRPSQKERCSVGPGCFPYRWHFDARVTKPVRAFALDARCLRQKCQTDTQLHYELLIRLMPVIGDRLDATRRKLVDLYLA